MIPVLLSRRTLLKCLMDGGKYNLLSSYDYEILWRIIESESLKLCLTDISVQSALLYCRQLGGNEWASKFIAKLKSDSRICPVTSEILSEARLSENGGDLDFEDIVEVICVKAYQLEALVSDRSLYFEKAPTKVIGVAQLLEYVPISFKLWIAYTLENQRDFTAWNLQDENLVGLDLAESNFTRANIAGAELINTNLSDCCLAQADLSQAWLMDADLSGSTLVKANLQGADLSGANCSGGDFTGASITGANFSHANLERVKAASVDWSGVELKDVDTSAIDLHGANLQGFNVRNISSLNELKQAFEVMSYQSGASALDFVRLKQWWTAYPNGIKALFYQKQIIAGVFMMWALTEESAQSLQQQVKAEQFHEPDLEICSSQVLRKTQGSRYWYAGGVYLNYSLRNSSNFSVNYLAFLLSESLKVWLFDEGKYIQKDAEIKLFTFYPSRNNNYQRRYGFQKQPGRRLDNKLLYKLSVPYGELELRLQHGSLKTSVEVIGKGSIPILKKDHKQAR